MGGGASSARVPDFALQLPFSKAFRIVFIGLNGAGKSTALYRLKLDEYIETTPTVGFNAEKVNLKLTAGGRKSFNIWDAGGDEKIRPLWRSYLRGADGIVFVVDSIRTDLFEEARTELHRVAHIRENSGVPLLVLANKQDLPAAASDEDIEQVLGLEELRGLQRQCHVEPTCAIIGEGLTEGMDTLHGMIQKHRRVVKTAKRLAKKWKR